MNVCKNCGKETKRSHNYCNWDCAVELAKKSGGVAHTPNNLPIRCIRHDGLMLEVEGGDHQDYKFPVDVEYIGVLSIFDMVDDDGNTTKCDEVSLHMQTHETHALIYTDGYVAVTLYEHCYAMWHLASGGLKAGSMWKHDDWKLTSESLAKVLAFAENQNKSKRDV